MEEKLIAEEIVQRLIQKEWKIAFAESCTGGLAAATLVEVPDASRVLDEGMEGVLWLLGQWHADNENSAVWRNRAELCKKKKRGIYL